MNGPYNPSKNPALDVPLSSPSKSNILYVWISYDTSTLSFFVSTNSEKPSSAFMQSRIDLDQYVPLSSGGTFVGFFAGNSPGSEAQVTILSWAFLAGATSFSDTDSSDDLTPGAVAGIVIGCVLGVSVVVLLMIGLMYRGRQQKPALVNRTLSPAPESHVPSLIPARSPNQNLTSDPTLDRLPSYSRDLPPPYTEFAMQEEVVVIV